jgi:hypothetical protein
MATTYELANRAEAKNARRYGDVPLGAVIRGDERYNRPGLFNGPRGWDYWNRLEGPGAYQNPNLWPDKRPTYFWARMGWGPADSPSAEGPGYTVEGRLADGTLLSGEQVVGRFSRPGIDLPPQVDAEMWYGLVNAQDNDPRLEAETTPARADSQWENFYGMKYTVVGAFKGPEAREKMGLPRTMEVGGDPTTQYMVIFTHRRFDPLYVLRGKMPTFPDTFAGTKTMPGGQVQYWSNRIVGSGPSGEVWDGLSDMQAPLDADGYYTVVASGPEDWPANATEAPPRSNPCDRPDRAVLAPSHRSHSSHEEVLMSDQSASANARRRVRDVVLLTVAAVGCWLLAKLVPPHGVHAAVIPTLVALGARHFRRGKRTGEHGPKHPAVRFVLAAWNEGDFSEAGKYVAPDLAMSINGLTDDSAPEGDGPAMAKDSVEYWRAIIPDLKMDLSQEIRQKDRIAIEWLITGTHTGERPELPASGNLIELQGSAFLTLKDDKIVQVSTVFDALALAVQTGAAEAPAWWPGRSHAE